jgi:secreted trypsin-like serine protease
MKKLSVCAALLLILIAGALPAGAITWGELDTEHTNVGAMVIDHPTHGVYQVCSGTLIAPQLFLTAGHCTDYVEESGITTVWVNFDQNAVNEDTLLDVAQVLTHPDYAWGGANPHDVGLLVLAEPVDIEPATMPTEDFLDDLKKEGLLREGPLGAKFTLVGYGGTLEWPPPEITYDDLRRVAESEYKSLPGPWLHMSQNSLQGDEGTCFGDSGGPAFWTEPDGTEILVGITSWGDAQCVATSFNYRVDIPETMDFIDSVLESLE